MAWAQLRRAEHGQCVVLLGNGIAWHGGGLARKEGIATAPRGTARLRHNIVSQWYGIAWKCFVRHRHSNPSKSKGKVNQCVGTVLIAEYRRGMAQSSKGTARQRTGKATLHMAIGRAKRSFAAARRNREERGHSQVSHDIA